MYFDIVQLRTDGDKKVQMGLSPGELRQSLLDRIAADGKRDKTTTTKHRQYVADLARPDSDIPDGATIEDILYDYVDHSSLHATRWEFLSETLEVRKVS